MLHLSRKIILANPKIGRSKMQPLSGNLRPDLLTILTHVSLVLRLPRNASLEILFKCPTPAIVFGNAANPHVLLTFEKVPHPLRLPRETTSERPKVVRACGALYVLTSTCASRHSSVRFFNISSSKVLRRWCFLRFDFEMCFAPQWRAIVHLSSGPMAPQPPL